MSRVPAPHERPTTEHKLREVATQIRRVASHLLTRSEKEPAGAAVAAAEALSAVSDSLETVAEGAGASGRALRDRGRDAAQALSRGERVLREEGLPGAVAGTAAVARRNVGKLALAGAGVLTLVAFSRFRNAD
ncbi:MAG: hypothetical protein P8170_19885 [Gemmatimonadota bacterium]